MGGVEEGVVDGLGKGWGRGGDKGSTWDRVHGLTGVGNQSSGAVNRLPPRPPWARHLPCQIPLIPSLVLGRVHRGPITSARFFNRRGISLRNRVVSDSLTQGVPLK